MSKKKDGEISAIALRYSEKFAPAQGTIQAHIDVINEHGFVWYGKMGKTISDRAINALLENQKPLILLIDSGKTDRFWATITEIKKRIPEDRCYPEYYKENIDKFTVWFKIIKIRKAPNDILSNCTVASSGAVLSEASKRSMSPFFMIKVEEKYI